MTRYRYVPSAALFSSQISGHEPSFKSSGRDS